MKKALRLVPVALILVLAFAAAGCGEKKQEEASTPAGESAAATDNHRAEGMAGTEAKGTDGHAADATPSTGNPVRDEMIALREAYNTLIDAVLHNKPETVEEAFHKVHEKRQATEKALEAGQVKLPRNGDKMEEFVKMDEEFHATIEKAVEAANAKDMTELTKQSQAMLGSCVACHKQYKQGY